MNSDDRTPCLQEEDIPMNFFLESNQKGDVIKWGPKDDLNNFLQQTVNCLDACEMAIKCGFAQMSSESMQAQWDQINNKHKNKWDLITNSYKSNSQKNSYRSLNSNFVPTQDYEIKAKSAEGADLTPQKFWMFHRVDCKEIYVAFTSQETSAYILSDADVWKMPSQKDIALVDNIPVSLFQGLLLQDYHLVFTGHSLGGAIAILTTCKLVMKGLTAEYTNKISCITFGAPSVPYQNLGQMSQFDKVFFRYELPKDPVPQLLTAFQRADNPRQEFLISLMNLLGLQHSFKRRDNLDFGFWDFVELNESRVHDIQISSKLGNVLIPQNKGVRGLRKHYMDDKQEWHHLKNLNLNGSQKQTKLHLSEFIQDLVEQHQFERYVQELFQARLNNIELKKVCTKPIVWDMAQFRIPGSDLWTYQPLNLNNHPNQVKAVFDEKFTKVIVMSKHPHVLGIRFGEIQEYPKWGKAPAQIQQDWCVYKIMFVFYSADNYKDLKKNGLIKIKLCGCFETVENVLIKAEQSCDKDASEIRGSAYDDMHLQQLYTSAFQVSLFAGEGHNPMLAKNQSEYQRSSLLREDHYSLVENLGSLIVNQKCLEIILEQNRFQIQNLWAQQKQLKACDTQMLQGLSEDNKQDVKLVEIAKMNLKDTYNSFKFNPKDQPQTSTIQKCQDAKACVEFNPKDQPQTSTTQKCQDAKACVEKSIPTLFGLSCSLIWQMKMFLWSQSLLFGIAGGAGFGLSAAAYGAVGAAAAQGFILTEAIMATGMAVGTAAGAAGAAAGGIVVAGVGLITFLVSLSLTGYKFAKFFKNFEGMQIQYRVQLQDLLKKFGYQVQEQHSVAVLENKISMICQWLLQEDGNGYSYDKSERDLNEKILEYILKTNDSQERATQVETELKQLIKKKIDFLSSKRLIKKNSRGLAALLLFIWNNYRIRLCLSKTLRIGVVGCKNAGKSTLCKMLGCAIERTGENQTTTDAILYQNVPAKHFCVVDFPHLNSIEGNNTMKMFYSLSDITIIVMKSQNRALEEWENKEIAEIIKSIQTKYNQSSFENRRWPVLLLCNQMDKMIFDSNGNDPDDQKLSLTSKEYKTEIVKNLEKYGIHENKVKYLFASLEPQLPKASQEKVAERLGQLLNQLNTNQITQEEYIKRNLELVQNGAVDEQRLQNITKCSFFNKQYGTIENPQTIVSTLAEMVQDLGDQQRANSIVDHFLNNQQ